MNSRKKKRQKMQQKQRENQRKRHSRQNTVTVTLDGWMAHQNVNRAHVWVCDNKGKKVGEFMKEERLTAEQLKEYIIYCRKYPVKEEM